MSNHFPVLPIYLSKTIDNNEVSKFKYYSVQYNSENMNEFLEELKEKYSQTFREYGNEEDIAKLQYYKVMDSTFDEEKHRYKLVAKIIKNGRCGEPNELLYRYTKYPVIYKLIKDMLDNDLFNLYMLCYYIEQLDYAKKTQTMSIEFTVKLTGIDEEKLLNDDYFLKNRNKMNLFTEKENSLNIEEYNEIINKFFKLLKFKTYSKKIISKKDCYMAINNANYINHDLFGSSKLVKELKKKYSL